MSDIHNIYITDPTDKTKRGLITASGELYTLDLSLGTLQSTANGVLTTIDTAVDLIGTNQTDKSQFTKLTDGATDVTVNTSGGLNVSGLNFVSLTASAVDANASSVTSSLDIKENKNLCFSVEGASGTHATHIVTLQISTDDSTFTDTASTITGEGILDGITSYARYCRAKVTTVEGGVSTINIIIQGK